MAYSNKCSLKGGGVSNVCSGLLSENCSPTVYLSGELLGGRAVVLTNQELPGDRDRNMETLLRQLLDLVTEQAEITNGQVGLIKQDLTGLDKSSLYDVAHASGVVSGRLQVLRAIESLLVDYTK